MSNNVARDITPKDRSTAFLVFGFLFACYLLTYTGYIDSSDGLSTFATTESLVRRGAFDSNQVLWMGNQQGNIGVGGDLFTRKGLGMVALAAPLAWLALFWPAIGLVHTSLLVNPLLTAWTGAIFSVRGGVWAGGVPRPLPQRCSLGWPPWPGPTPRAISVIRSVPGVSLLPAYGCSPRPVRAPPLSLWQRDGLGNCLPDPADQSGDPAHLSGGAYLGHRCH